MKMVFFADLSRYRTENDFAFMLIGKYCSIGAIECTKGSSRIAFASSSVSLLRLKTSGGRRPPTVGGMRWTKIRFAPRSWICDEMLLFSPLMMDDIPITVATPITTPSTVRNDRSLFLRRESSASSKISFISQCHNGIEIGRFRCRINPEEKTDTRRNEQAKRHRPPLDRSGQGRHPRNGQRK